MNFLMGLWISQKSNDTHTHTHTHIYHSEYNSEMIKKFQMEDYKPINTSMVTGCKLRNDDDFKEVDQRWQKSMIGGLLYVTTSRLDIMQDVGMAARFQSAPKETHVQAMKIIL